MSETLILPLDAAVAPVVWPDVAGFFAESLAHNPGYYAPEHILEEIMGGKVLLWLILVSGSVRGAFTTRLVQLPLRRALYLEWGGGVGMKSWLSATADAIVAHAKAHGCRSIEMPSSRSGWARALKRHCAVSQRTAYSMEL